MHALILTALMAGAAATAAAPPPSSDRAGNRMLAFAPLPATDPAAVTEDKDHGARHCTSDGRWCAQFSRDAGSDGWQLQLLERNGTALKPAWRWTPPDNGGGSGGYRVWPHIIAEAGGAYIIGVESAFSTGYSGGGASLTRLDLLRWTPGDAAGTPVLGVTLESSALIRACFGEKDFKQRAGACHDEYRFGATLALVPENAAGRPRLTYTTRAESWPGRVSRAEDSLAKPPLRKKDLVWARDPICSYRRVFGFDAKTGTYAPDRALPDCASYEEL